MRTERPSRREDLPTGTDRTNRLWKRNLLITAVVALAAFLLFFLRGGGAMRAVTRAPAGGPFPQPAPDFVKKTVYRRFL